MPFTFQLKHWAAQRPHHPAVIAGAQSLTYSRLLSAATSVPQAEAPGVSVINEPTSVELAVQLCSAALQGRTSMVLDAGWPAPLQRRLRERALVWDGRSGKDDGAQPFLLGLSSGTSGTPKAFVRTAVSWQASFEVSARYFSVGAETRTLAPGPLAASMNLYALGESLFTGGVFIVLPQFSPDAALAAMAEHAVNRLVLVPAVLELIARRGLALNMDAAALRHIVCAGAALSPEAVELARMWAPNAAIQQYYGAAELGFVTAAEVGTGGLADAGSSGDGGVGTAFPGVELSIRDEEGTQMPAGGVGLVSVKSPYLCDGYAWGDDGLAFTAMGDDGWYTVHDRGAVGADGVLRLAGRASDMIITSGSNVYPHAVEEVLQRDLDGCDVVVAGIPDALRGQRVVAAFRHRHGNPTGAGPASATSASGAAPTGIGATAAVMEALRHNAATLPASHKPAGYFELDELPLTGSGKTSRDMLTQWILEGDARARRQP